jgi:hypothetical protein
MVSYIYLCMYSDNAFIVAVDIKKNIDINYYRCNNHILRVFKTIQKW